jgi:hypothetical protein
MPLLDGSYFPIIYNFDRYGIFCDIMEGFYDVVEPTLGIHEYDVNDDSEVFYQGYKSRIVKIGGIIIGDENFDPIYFRMLLTNLLSFDGKSKMMQVVSTILDGSTLNTFAEVHPYSKLSITPVNNSPAAFRWDISLYIKNHVFLGEERVTIGYPAVNSGGFSIPLDIPFDISGSIQNIITIENSGNAKIYPNNVRIVGPGSNFSIINRITGETVTYTGTLLSTDYVDIDFKTKTAVKNGNINVYEFLGGDFFKLTAGDNTYIAFIVGSGATVSTQIIIRSNDGYMTL